MHVNAKKMAFTGVLAAFAVILLVLSAVIETSSLFLIAAGGILCRDCIAGMGNQGRCSVFDGKFSGGADCGAESSVLYYISCNGNLFGVERDPLGEGCPKFQDSEKDSCGVDWKIHNL